MASVDAVIKARNSANGWDNIQPETTLEQVTGLIVNGKIDPAIIPQQAITDVEVVSSQSAMLALTSLHRGDVAIRTDIGKTFILNQAPASTLANWVELPIPSDTVSSVNTKPGPTVTLNGADIKLDGYAIASAEAAIATGDTINQGLSKLEYKVGRRAPINMSLADAAANATLPGTGSLALTAILQTMRNNLKSLFADTTSLKARPIVTASVSEPASPRAGDIWFDLDG
jgi:hypothetical protein